MKGLTKMKVKNNSTIDDYSDIHSSKKSLISMIESTCRNISNSVRVEKEDDYQRMFNKSISKTLKQRQLYS